MRGSIAAIAATAALSAATSAQACIAQTQLRLEDVRQADVIVIGHVKHFDPIRVARDRKIDWYSPARLTLEVDETILGQSSRIMTVDWHQATNHGPPKSIRGSYLVALRQGPSNGASPNRLMVLQDACSGSFVFQRGGGGANAVRAIYGLPPESLVPLPRSLAESLEDRLIRWPTLVAYGFVAFSVLLIGLIVLWPRRPKSNPVEDSSDLADPS